MPLEIRELVVKLTVEDTVKKNQNTPEVIRNLEERVQQLDEKLMHLTETIENIYAR